MAGIITVSYDCMLKTQSDVRYEVKRLLAAAALFSPSLAQAAEFGILRPLQHGPIGDSPQFIDLKGLEAEALLQTNQVWGKYQINDDADRQVRAFGYKAQTAAGAGWAPAKNLLLTAYIHATLASDLDERQTRGEQDSVFDSGLYRHEFAVFGVYKAQPVILGASVGLLVVGGENRLFKYTDGASVTQSYQEASRAGLPMMRLFGGVTTKPFDGTLGVRFFSKGDSVVTAYDKENGKKTAEYDIIRRNPGEVYVDGRFKLDDGFVAGSFAYVLQGQASEQVNEWSVRYTQDGTAKFRLTGDERRNTDQFRVAVGGRYEPTKTLGLLGGLSYLSSYYAKPEYASVEQENLGGMRLDLGGELEFKPFKSYLQMGYLLDSSISASNKGDGRSATRLGETQRFPLSDGDRVKTSQGRWDIALGGGMVF